jgi:hypothetical protein
VIAEELFGVKVLESRYVNEGEMIVLGNGDEYPPEWETMTDLERIAWAVAHGRAVLVKNIDALRSQNQHSAKEGDRGRSDG